MKNTKFLKLVLLSMIFISSLNAFDFGFIKKLFSKKIVKSGNIKSNDTIKKVALSISSGILFGSAIIFVYWLSHRDKNKQNSNSGQDNNDKDPKKIKNENCDHKDSAIVENKEAVKNNETEPNSKENNNRSETRDNKTNLLVKPTGNSEKDKTKAEIGDNKELIEINFVSAYKNDNNEPKNKFTLQDNLGEVKVDEVNKTDKGILEDTLSDEAAENNKLMEEACDRLDLEAIKLLIEKGVPIDRSLIDKMSPSRFSDFEKIYSKNENFLEIIKLFIEKGLLLVDKSLIDEIVIYSCFENKCFDNTKVKDARANAAGLEIVNYIVLSKIDIDKDIFNGILKIILFNPGFSCNYFFSRKRICRQLILNNLKFFDLQNESHNKFLDEATKRAFKNLDLKLIKFLVNKGVSIRDCVNFDLCEICQKNEELNKAVEISKFLLFKEIEIGLDDAAFCSIVFAISGEIDLMNSLSEKFCENNKCKVEDIFRIGFNLLDGDRRNSLAFLYRNIHGSRYYNYCVDYDIYKKFILNSLNSIDSQNQFFNEFMKKAFENLDLETIKLLIDKGVSLNGNVIFPVLYKIHNKENGLKRATRISKFLANLVDEENVDINWIYFFAMGGEIDLFKKFMEEYNDKERLKETFKVMFEFENVEVVKYFFESGKVFVKDNHWQDFILEKLGVNDADKNKLNFRRIIELFNCNNGSKIKKYMFEYMKYFIESGFISLEYEETSINKNEAVVNENGYIGILKGQEGLIFMAVSYNCLDLLEYLLEKGVKIDLGFCLRSHNRYLGYEYNIDIATLKFLVDNIATENDTDDYGQYTEYVHRCDGKRKNLEEKVCRLLYDFEGIEDGKAVEEDNLKIEEKINEIKELFKDEEVPLYSKKACLKNLCVLHESRSDLLTSEDIEYFDTKMKYSKMLVSCEDKDLVEKTFKRQKLKERADSLVVFKAGIKRDEFVEEDGDKYFTEVMDSLSKEKSDKRRYRNILNLSLALGCLKKIENLASDIVPEILEFHGPDFGRKLWLGSEEGL